LDIPASEDRDMSWHPASPINIEEGYRDLEATPPRSTTNSTEDVAPLPASTPPTQVQQASRRRGATGAGGGDVAEGNEFTGDEDGDAAQQARLHMHVAIDMAALQQAAALTGENAPTESVSCIHNSDVLLLFLFISLVFIFSFRCLLPSIHTFILYRFIFENSPWAREKEGSH
jgi:hypothetical protein